MFIIQREIENQISEKLFKNGMVVILGPRQSGKTTLSKKIIETFGGDGMYYNCEFAEVRKHLVLGKPEILKEFIGDNKIIVLDEAQTVPNIGKILKVFYDTYPEIQIIATGSSSFDLANKIKEPMTGRAYEFILPPLTINEIKTIKHVDENILRELMLYGNYPAVVLAHTESEKQEQLKRIATNYLFKDVYIFEALRNPKTFEDLLIHLAQSLGSTVSAGKLGKELGVAPATIEKYIRLLEQSFVIKRIYSYSKNYANELKKSYKIYFYDNGIRNALLGSFSNFEQDKGVLFENLFFIEKFKKTLQQVFPERISFWRTKEGYEIDFILEKQNILYAYECKYGNEEHSFKTFLKYYSNSVVQIMRPKDLLE